jgi:hypothetical protein
MLAWLTIDRVKTIEKDIFTIKRQSLVQMKPNPFPNGKRMINNTSMLMQMSTGEGKTIVLKTFCPFVC